MEVPTCDTPLLVPQQKQQQHGVLGFFKLDREEVKMQLKIAVPMILTNIFQYAINLVSLMFAGHLGELELAGAALASSWAVVTGQVIMVGLTGALETLCGQAYGAREYLMLGVYLQASMIVTFVCAIFVTIFWLYSEPIFILMGQRADVSVMASIYLKSLIPGIYAYAMMQSLTRFFQTQSIVMPLAMCSVFPLILHFGLCYLLVHQTTLGFHGAALANSISFWLIVFCLVLYMKLGQSCQNTWGGFSQKAFKVIGPFLKLGSQSAIMVCLEYWAFEILVLVAGLLPDSEMNTSLISISVNTECLAYMITFGFSAAVSTRVSNEIGAGNEHKAKLAVTVTVKLAVMLACAISVLLLFGHNIWAAAFSDSWKIRQKFATMAPLLAASIFFDAIQGILSGVARGCGWQHLAAWTNLLGFYIIGMPIAIFLAFVLKLNSKGLWTGILCGISSQTCILLLISFFLINWTKMVQDAQDRLGGDAKQALPTTINP
ncbi:hypothetical protein SUGI_0580830 [Cryptomeria japonica]|uniref:protein DETOXIFICATION 19 n=1 Tax=Cryptomeria japonica TaxID=3369 RepID=UPI002414BB8F|nr:protein DETOXIFICATION 19 [Cryptomeria japonica]GLJ29466.1 hypothetical protein SUGI_0580830 [Cryptomeria japonica]